MSYLISYFVHFDSLVMMVMMTIMIIITLFVSVCVCVCVCECVCVCVCVGGWVCGCVCVSVYAPSIWRARCASCTNKIHLELMIGLTHYSHDHKVRYV